MPDYTVSSDIDNLLRSTDNADARTNLGAAAASHTHGTGDITGLDAAISANTDVAANTLKETNVDTNLGYTASATNGVVTSSDGTDATITLADGTNAGLLTPADFTKLGTIEDNADVTDSANVVSSLDSANLTDAGTPAATDQVLIKDASTGALQTADFSDFGGGAVDSVNSQTGIVVLDADDIDDTTTAHKFATAAQLANADSALQATDIDTIAELNAILTDANLDDSSAARTPTAHTHALSDLTQSGATDGQIVAWNNTAGEWQPINNTGGAVQNWYITKMGNEADDATGTGEKTAWIAPANGKINAVHSGCSTATAGAALTVDVQKNAVTILSTKGVIASADDSTTTGTAHVLTSSPTSFVAGDRISFHIDTFGGTGAKGLHTDLLISWD